MTTPVEPHMFVQRFLGENLQRMGHDPGKLRVLDVGCGRGDTVAWLLACGWDAHGVDISSANLERGREYLSAKGFDPHRLHVLQGDLAYPFDDGSFSLVLSNQVIEHVFNLDSFGQEVARVSARGSAGLHIYPAKWRPIEVHTGIPFAHWLPKGRVSQVAIATALRSGVAAPYFRNLSRRDRANVFINFNETEAFYRPLRQVVATLERYGLVCDPIGASRDKVEFHIPQLPKISVPICACLYRHAFSVVLRTLKTLKLAITLLCRLLCETERTRNPK